jgi:hypothetical protein
MSDSEMFENALQREFRWPKKGDHPFSESPDQQRNASIARHGHERLVLMMTGYKAAADLMVERAARSGYDRDTLVFPIVFNYRHFIELSLKYLIATYGRTVNVESNWKSHDLADLWRTFKRVVKAYGNNDPEHTDRVVEHIIAEFAKVDPGSSSYRYPVDRDGKLLELSQDQLDLQSLADVMQSLEGYFMGCDGWMDDQQSALPSEY